MVQSVFSIYTGSESFCEVMQEEIEEDEMRLEPNDAITRDEITEPKNKHEDSSRQVNCTIEDSGLGAAGEDSDCLGKRNADEGTKENVNGEPETQIRAKRKRKKVVRVSKKCRLCV